MSRSFRQLVEDCLPDRLPIDVQPASNGEFVPRDPTREEKAIMRVAMEECDRQARHHGLSRRRFLQTGAAYAACLAAINHVMGVRGYALAEECVPPLQNGLGTTFPLDYPDAQLNNLAGEFVMDLQTHHVDSGGVWRARNPGQAAFFNVAWSQASCGEQDRMECLGRFHYMKELFLDSSTNVTILSAVPFREDGNPLPLVEAAKTCEMVEQLAGGTRRAYMHRFVMPNRGSLGSKSDGALGKGAYAVEPVFWPEERDLMTAAAEQYGSGGYLRGWKVYCPWGDVPYTTGWWLDDPVGIKFIEHAQFLASRHDMPALVCAHKGFALTAFDQEKAATRDVGRVARMFPNVDFMIYHSGYDGDSISPLTFPPTNQGTSTTGPYPLDTFAGGLGSGSDAAVRSIDRGVDNFIKALRENGWSARNFAPGGRPTVPGHTGADDLEFSGDGDPSVHANVPNVYAELGSVWSSVSGNPTRASYLLGKLIYYVGAKRIVWGTDSLWYGSPQAQIVLFRAFQMTDEIKELYDLPYGLEGDVEDPTQPAPSPARTIRNGILGRNAAAAYRIDPDATLAAVRCDDVQRIRDEYLLNPATPPVARGNEILGPRTRRELFASLRQDPWYRGAIRELNAKGFGKRPV